MAGKDSPLTRRTLFQIAGAAPLAAAATAAEARTATAATKSPAGSRKVFNESQWRTVKVLSDLILPADDHSGSASMAGVPEFLDDWIAFRKAEDGNDNLQAEIFGGLMWLDRESNRLFGRPFASALAEQQRQILDRIAWPERAAKEDGPWAAFFARFRELTVSGFYSSKVGVADLRYLGNTAVAEWTGCDGKTWSMLEDRMARGYQGVVEAKPWPEA